LKRKSQPARPCGSIPISLPPESSSSRSSGILDGAGPWNQTAETNLISTDHLVPRQYRISLRLPPLPVAVRRRSGRLGGPARTAFECRGRCGPAWFVSPSGRTTASESSEKQCEWPADATTELLVPKLTSNGTSLFVNRLKPGHLASTRSCPRAEDVSTKRRDEHDMPVPSWLSSKDTRDKRKGGSARPARPPATISPSSRST